MSDVPLYGQVPPGGALFEDPPSPVFTLSASPTTYFHYRCICSNRLHPLSSTTASTCAGAGGVLKNTSASFTIRMISSTLQHLAALQDFHSRIS